MHFNKIHWFSDGNGNLSLFPVVCTVLHHIICNTNVKVNQAMLSHYERKKHYGSGWHVCTYGGEKPRIFK